jgi:putative membrane protein
MFLKKGQLLILTTNILALIFFIILFIRRENYEFLIYIGVIVFFLAIIVFTNKKINYPNAVLWGLTLWSILHMTGGGIFINGKKVYEIILWPIAGEPYNIFKYDQLVHIIGFGVATLAMYYLVRPLLNDNFQKKVALSVVIIMAGLGVGALNEIVEFLATVIIPETGVGGYENTSLDLVADLIGAVGAMGYIIAKEKNNKPAV